MKKSCVNGDILRVNFFKGVMPLNCATPIIIAINRERLDVNDEPFVLGIMTRKIGGTTKDECEYTISGTRRTIVIQKRKWCVTIKMLFCKNVVENTYYIPNKAKELKIPISDVYYPGEVADLTRKNYLICTIQSEVQDNNQVNNVYI